MNAAQAVIFVDDDAADGQVEKSTATNSFDLKV